MRRYERFEMSARGVSAVGASSAGDLVDDQEITLFLLAHPDDELLLAALLDRLVLERTPVCLIYLTDGASRGVSAGVRNAESIAVLASLGIDPSKANFIGNEIGIPDGQLYRHLHRAFEAVEELCRRWKKIANIYTFAWEGGHVDHDAAHVVAAAFAESHGLDFWQVSLYRAADSLPAPFFTLSSPLAENGPIISVPLSARQRRLPRQLIRFYPSQWRSFIGLGPLIIWHSLTRRVFKLQRGMYRRLWERPTMRPLLYERRNGVTFHEFSAAAVEFLESRIGRRENPSLPVARSA
jgi:LmbE family N-acetylglucosaminyl deacetylase